MTTQVSDRIFHNGRTYFILEEHGQGLFDPYEFGIEPVSLTTACWRGYHCDYAISNEQLILTELYIGLDDATVRLLETSTGLKLFGNTPSSYTESVELIDLKYGTLTKVDRTSIEHKCTNLKEPVSFTGILLIGSNFIENIYGMEQHPAHKYRELWELFFDNGILIGETQQFKA